MCEFFGQTVVAWGGAIEGQSSYPQATGDFRVKAPGSQRYLQVSSTKTVCYVY